MTNFKKAAVIGWPIKHSRSPLIHQYWLKTHSIEGSYEKIAVPPEALDEFLNSLGKQGFAGVNVTVPHKEAVFKFAEHVTDEAKAIGAANTLWFEDEKLIAGNTDAYGFITHLKLSAPNWQTNKPALILGAGGAARAIIYALRQAGVPEVRIANRTLERAQTLCQECGPIVKPIEWQSRNEALSECGLLVNSTSLGMQGNAPLEILLENLSAGAVVYDIVYSPLETELLKTAKNQGFTSVDGLGMLLHQAVLGFEKWFGVHPQVTDELRNLVLNDLVETT